MLFLEGFVWVLWVVDVPKNMPAKLPSATSERLMLVLEKFVVALVAAPAAPVAVAVLVTVGFQYVIAWSVVDAVEERTAAASKKNHCCCNHPLQHSAKKTAEWQMLRMLV